MAIIQTQIRWADNTAELAANLKSGLDQIEAMKSSADRLTTSLGGDGLFKAANNLVAAISQLGDTTKLTDAEQQKASATLDAAIDKYHAMGLTVPTDVQRVADSLSNVSDVSLKSIPIIGQLIAAFSAERIAAFVQSAIDSAAALDVLSRSTGVSTEGLQQLGYVGQGVGLDIDQLSRGVEQFSTKLASGDGNAVKAVQMLGLSATDLVSAGPLQAFLQFTAAAATVADPMQKNALYADAFGGKLGKLLSSLGDVSSAMKSVPSDAIISQANIDQAAAFDTGLAHLETTAKAWTVSALGWLDSGSEMSTAFLNLVASFATGTPTFNLFTQSLKDNKAAVDAKVGSDIVLLSNSQLWQNQIDALTAKQANLTNVDMDQIAAESALGVSNKDLAGHYGLTETAVASLLDAHKKYEEALVEINAAGVGWKGTLDTIDGSVVEAIKYYLDAGVSQSSLATAYGLTAVQVKSVATELTNETAAQKIENEATLLTAKVWADYFQNQSTLYASDVQKATAAADQKYQVAVAEAQKKGITDVGYYNALWALRDQDVSKAQVDSTALYTNSVNNLQAIYDKAQATYVAMETDGLIHTQAQAQHFRDLRDAALDALHGIIPGQQALGTAFDAVNASIMGVPRSFAGWNAAVQGGISMLDALGLAASDTSVKVQTLSGELITVAQAQQRFNMGNQITYDISTPEGLANFHALNPGAYVAWSDAQIMAFAAKGGTLQQLEQQGVINLYAGIQSDLTATNPTLPGFASGVTNFAGGFAMVGEHGPEMAYLPPGSNVYPNGKGPGGGDTYVINVTGAFGTMKQVTDAVSEGIARSYGRKS